MGNSKGLGDTIAAVTSTLKLDKLATQIATGLGKKDCGCNSRQDWLNKKVPYNTKANNTDIK
tara:strand:+ start:1113 stop:1298 length:186 start_codon:yes stop_codon:yes gene_type:complete